MFWKKPAYERGEIMHFYNYVVEQCEKALARAEIKKGTFSAVRLYSVNQDYLVLYWIDGTSLMVSSVRTDKNGLADYGRPYYTLSYDGKKFSEGSNILSSLNANEFLKTRKILSANIAENLYDLFEADKLVPCFKIGRDGSMDVIQSGVSKVVWRGSDGVEKGLERATEESALFGKNKKFFP